MKKAIVVTLAASMALSMTACSNSSAPATTTAAATTAAAKTEEKKEEAAASAEASEALGWKDGSTVYVDVPAKAGGGTDLYTRYLTGALGEVCPNVNFVVTNYDTSEVGMQHAKNADGDGLTLATCHGGAIIQYLCGSSEVNIKDDMKVVGILNQGGPQAIIATPDAPYHSFAELGEYIKAHENEVVIGCSLGGTTQVLFYSLVDALTGTPDAVNYVQCSNEADKLTNVASKAIDIANCSIPNAVAYEADGKVTILGILGPKSATRANVAEMCGADLGEEFATTLEQGVDMSWDSNYYVLAPASTPDDVCQAINAAICKAVEQDSFKEGNLKMATFIDAVSYEDAKQDLESEWAFLDELTGGMGLKVR